MATTTAKKAVKKTTSAPRRAAKKTEVANADVKAEAVNAEAVPAEAPVSAKVAKVAKPKAATTSAKSTKTTKITKSAKPAAKSAKPAKPATAATAEAKAKRVKKEKVVRDSFTMPKSDYAKLASLKQKCLEGGVRVKKSELLRAALAMLDAAPAKNLIEAVGALEMVKTGRPANA